jgi:glycosyl transferase family 87
MAAMGSRRAPSAVLAILALLAALAFAPTAVAAENPAHQPPFGDEPLAPLHRVHDLDVAPPGFELNAADAIEIADGASAISDERAESPAMKPQASTRGTDSWQIDYFQDGVDVAQAVIDDRTGAVIEAWRNQQVEVKLARGYEDAVAGNVNEAWIWIPLCLLFVAPFFDPRRPFRLLHLDLLVLLSFSISQFFFNKGEIVASVPLVYPVLAYLFVRMLLAGFRPRRGEGPLIPVVPIRWLTIGVVLLAVFRIGFNVVDSQVIDIGFANVVGADRIAKGEGVYDGQFTPLIDRGDSYGPVSYLSYVPFEQVLPWDGGLDPLPAAHAAAIVFDLAVVALLIAAGRRLREGMAGRELGIALAFAWLAYPYTFYALDANGGNDALVAALLVAALLLVASPLKRGLAIGVGAATKFGPLALAPLFAAGPGERRLRSTVIFSAAFVAVWAVVLLPLLPDGGLREFYDRTFGYQASRGSPFSIWGLKPSLDRVQDLARVFPVLLGAALFFVPKRRTPLQIAALGAAVLIATQVGSTHWFYFFILWWTPYVLINLFASHEEISGVREPDPKPSGANVLSAATRSS